MDLWIVRNCPLKNRVAEAVLPKLAALSGLASSSIVRDPATGRPFFAEGPDFSLSHSRGTVAVALVPEGRVGLDIEFRVAGLKFAALLAEFLEPDAVSAFASLPPSRQEREFFEIWTAREAELKWTGEGLRGLRAGPGSAAPAWRETKWLGDDMVLSVVADREPGEIRWHEVEWNSIA